ncbi:MAG TPA: hypothetical protein VG738_01645 [Chitinophagaceae bacterium]|nr:hypothetical protein [Chitinophagaceae bacterium]
MATNDQNFLTTEVQRFTALDIFRGMTICFMIIVNMAGNGETTFAPLHHAHWNGFTPTDLVFPSFMFAVGNAMSFVMRRWNTYPTSKVLGKIFKRAAIIFLLGYLMYWFPFVHKNDAGNIVFNPIGETRIFGVLQRIALGYLFASLMIYFFKIRTTVIITILILILYWPVMMYFGDGPDPLDIHTNAVLKLDTWLIGLKHLYTGEGFPFDPEGFLSTFPAIGNVVAGYVVGKYVQEKGKTYEGIAKIMLAGFVLIVIAHFWNYQFPINKKLWTSSFVLHTVGIDCLILSGVIYLVDFTSKKSEAFLSTIKTVRLILLTLVAAYFIYTQFIDAENAITAGYTIITVLADALVLYFIWLAGKFSLTGRWPGFFETVGKNPLPVYLLSELLPIVFYIVTIGDKPLWNWMFDNFFGYATPYVGSLLLSVCYMLLCWSFGYFLDKKKVYIRV